jgi:hypothetical protein
MGCQFTNQQPGFMSNGDSGQRVCSSLLPPKRQLMRDLKALTFTFNLRHKGYGLIYLDDQPCNRSDHLRITHQLQIKYGASRSAITLRLKPSGAHGRASGTTGDISVAKRISLVRTRMSMSIEWAVHRFAKNKLRNTGASLLDAPPQSRRYSWFEAAVRCRSAA